MVSNGKNNLENYDNVLYTMGTSKRLRQIMDAVCAHGKGSSVDHKLLVSSVYEGPASPPPG